MRVFVYVLSVLAFLAFVAVGGAMIVVEFSLYDLPFTISDPYQWLVADGMLAALFLALLLMARSIHHEPKEDEEGTEEEETKVAPVATSPPPPQKVAPPPPPPPSNNGGVNVSELKSVFWHRNSPREIAHAYGVLNGDMIKVCTGQVAEGITAPRTSFTPTHTREQCHECLARFNTGE